MLLLEVLELLGTVAVLLLEVLELLVAVDPVCAALLALPVLDEDAALVADLLVEDVLVTFAASWISRTSRALAMVLELEPALERMACARALNALSGYCLS